MNDDAVGQATDESPTATSATDEINTVAALAALTGIDIPEGVSLAGRNVWGRVRFHPSAGFIHVEALPGDREITERVGKTIGQEEMKLGSKERYKLFRARCCQVAHEVNRTARDAGKLMLLVSSNGQLTQAAKVILKALS
jgi:hypothetical protein